MPEEPLVYSPVASSYVKLEMKDLLNLTVTDFAEFDEAVLSALKLSQGSDSLPLL